jgi:hypothetical protein
MAEQSLRQRNRSFIDPVLYPAANYIHAPSCTLNKALDLFERQSSRYILPIQDPIHCPNHNHPGYIQMAAATLGERHSCPD